MTAAASHMTSARGDGDRGRAREVVLRHGYNVTAYQILNPGITHWFSRARDAVAGYVRRPGAWVVAGAPVCAAGELAAVMGELEASAAADDALVCYVCAADRLRHAAAASGRHSAVTLGAQPVWDPRAWPAIVRRERNVRAQLNRARNKGVTVEEWPSGRAGTDPALRDCLAGWLADRPMPPMHFLVEPDTLDGPTADRRLFVAGVKGEVVAFAIASPVPARRGYLLEQIARKPHAPNGTAELLIDAAMRATEEQGGEMLTLGMVALSTHGPIRLNPTWVRALFTFARLHGRRFYHFNGLERFREKLCPQAWEPLYVIANRAHFTPTHLYAAASAFTHEPLPAFLARAAGRAIRDEAQRFRSAVAQMTSR